MPITLELTFPAGRYHATPWGRHVNEGVPEWPPSPWRFLRALVAVWRRAYTEALPESQVRRILKPLLLPPWFHLPASRVAHTRHYMPWEKKGPADRTLIFDTFVAVDRENPLLIHWPEAELPAEDADALGKLMENLTSLGRAESWVHAALSNKTAEWNCKPAETSNPDPVPVLCADPASAFDSEHYPTHDPKKLKKGLRPDDLLFDCPRWHLCLDTQTIHDRRWSRVPGSEWVNYKRPEEAVLVATPARSHRPTPTFARFALDGPVLPLVTETLPLAESVRRKLLEGCKRLQCPADPRRAYADLPSIAPAFWGKDEDRRPLIGHRHAFFLPVDEDNDGRIDHVAVFAPMGFTEREPQALDRLRRLRYGDLELSLALVGLGALGDFAGSRLLGPSTIWESATPFLVTRHLKRRGRKRDPLEWSRGHDGQGAFVRQVLREELDRRAALGVDRLAGAEIEPLADHAIGPRRLQSYDFHLGRAKRGDDGARRPRGAFRLRFPQPISGPIALGHSCHFGLGVFLCVGEAGRRAREAVSG